ncbi:MAG: Site-specific recombinase XerD [Ilumatobacteraceae bacterium]|nr:Site-specific recombinase XerD [Ilumatobacteraceae bacterium]
MAAIEKRHTSSGDRYDVRYRDPTGRLRRKTFRRLGDARTYARETEADVLRGDWTDPQSGKVTFAEWWDRWWPTTVNLRPSSRARDESYARNHLLPQFGPMRLASIDHTAVSAWVADLTHAGRAPATVVKAAQILGKTLDAAVDASMIRSNPTRRVKLPRIERHEMRFLDPEQVARLAFAIDERYAAMVLVGAYCGLRLGELSALRRERIDLLHRRVEVAETVTEVNGHHHVGPPKTRAGHRTVPIPRPVSEVLATHLDRSSGPLVFSAPNGGFIRPSLFRRRFWVPATAGADLAGVRVHDLRHTAVALWIAAGASPNAIAARAGHTSVVTVLDRYGHLLPGDDRADDALDAMASAVPTQAILRLA